MKECSMRRSTIKWVEHILIIALLDTIFFAKTYVVLKMLNPEVKLVLYVIFRALYPIRPGKAGNYLLSNSNLTKALAQCNLCDHV